MATRDEELQRMRGASPSAFTPFSQARGAEAIRGFGSGMAPRISEPQSVFSGSPQQYASQLPAPPSRPSDLFSTASPVFPSQLAQPMGQVPADLRSTPAVAPTTDAITSFGNPMASRTERITSPYGTASTTLTPEQQTQRFQARQQAEQMGTMPRTPEQQQALLAQIRQNAANLNRERTDWVQNTIQQRRENPTTYTTPSGMSTAVPTNRFGEPLKAWMDQLGDSGRLNYGPRPAPQTASATPSQPSQGIRFTPTPSRPIPMPVVDSMGTRIGDTSDFTSFGSTKRQEENPAVSPIRPSPLYAGMGAIGMRGGGLAPLESFASSVMGSSFKPFNVATMWPNNSMGPSVDVQLAPSRKDRSTFGFRV